MCLNPVPSYLAPTNPTHSDTRAQASISPLSLRPLLEPMYHTASHHNTVEWAHGQLLFVCTIYVNVQTAANGTVMQSFILAVLRPRPLG